MLESYKTITSEGYSEVIEKKSKFIGNAFPVKNEDDVGENLERIKKKHYDASHHVFAYQIGERNEVIRQSDDGEPSGTAGLPVLDILRSDDIKNTLIVVTRYFGGTLLGTGGLVKCYGKAAKDAIITAGVVEMNLCRVLHINVDYSLVGKIQYYVLQSGSIIDNTVYDALVSFTIFVKNEKCDSFLKDFTELTYGKVPVNLGEHIYIQNKI